MLDHARPSLEAVLTTINAPRPRHMDPEALMECIMSPVPLEAWKCHMQSLFDEVPVEALHRVVLSGAVDFEDLNRAARVWGIPGGETREWVAEMADFRLARPASENVPAD
jgi:hypothetical protein